MAKGKKDLFITGTDTDVGKTVVTAALAGILSRRGCKVGLMKPVQTGCRKEKGRLICPDLEFLFNALKGRFNRARPSPESRHKGENYPHAVYCFEPPVSPHLAARLAGEIISPEKIRKAYKRITAESDITLVEGIGGLMVPLNETYLVRDLIRDMHIAVIVVARPGLGTINHTLLTLEILRRSDIKIEGVIINGLDPDKAGLSERHNPGTIARIGKIKILGILPLIPGIDTAAGQPAGLVETAARHLNLDFLEG